MKVERRKFYRNAGKYENLVSVFQNTVSAILKKQKFKSFIAKNALIIGSDKEMRENLNMWKQAWIM